MLSHLKNVQTSKFWWKLKEKKRNFFQKFIKGCAADFSLPNLPKGKSLGRSKPATNS